ncbi:MAG TPA: hypothetical protein VJ417_05620, partial [Candidatus Glassbacteria bacterium]|nr:hypothetical protein [Candidatus Glassbacteria bacterium]
GTFHTQMDLGGYAGADVGFMAGTWGFEPSGLNYSGNGTWQGFARTGRYVITWQSSGGNVTVQVNETVRGKAVPFSPWIDEESWGFVPVGVDPRDVNLDLGATYPGYQNEEPPQSERTYKLVETLPAGNTDDFNLYVGGTYWNFSGISAMPATGWTMTMITAFGTWNGDGNEFTQFPGPAAIDDKWKIDIKGMTLNPEDIDLTKIRVVPNPYIASSTLDQSSGSRRIEFVNLPDRCTVRIYSLGGNLVNVLNHIAASRTGWGNFTDLDAIQPDNTPLTFTGYDNHGGTEAWNLKNRFGQTVASGLYFFHVTDVRGMTHTGKFYIVN